MQNKDRRVIKKSDLVIMGVILCVMALVFTLCKLPTDNALAEITLDGTLISTLKLDIDTSINLRDINSSYPDMNISVSDGYVYVEKADCYDEVCVHTGKINSKYQSIVCLPNKLVVNISNDNTDSNIDVVM